MEPFQIASAHMDPPWGAQPSEILGRRFASLATTNTSTSAAAPLFAEEHLLPLHKPNVDRDVVLTHVARLDRQWAVPQRDPLRANGCDRSLIMESTS